MSSEIEEPQPETVKLRPLDGQKLTQLRQFLAHSFNEFAHAIGVNSPSNIHYWENNGLSKNALSLIQKKYQIESDLFSNSVSLDQFNRAVSQILLANHINQNPLEAKLITISDDRDDFYLLNLEHEMSNRILIFDTFPSFAIKYSKDTQDLSEKNAATQLRFENINRVQRREYHNYSLRGVLNFIFNPVLDHSTGYKKEILNHAIEFFTSMNHSLFIFNEKSENIFNSFSDMQILFNDDLTKYSIIMTSPLFYSSQIKHKNSPNQPSDVSYFLQLEGMQVREYVDFYIHQIKSVFNHIDGFALLVVLYDYLNDLKKNQKPNLDQFFIWLDKVVLPEESGPLSNKVRSTQVQELLDQLEHYFNPLKQKHP